MYDSKLIRKKLEKQRKNNNSLKIHIMKVVNRALFATFLVLLTLTFIKIRPQFKTDLKKFVYQDNISFSKINEWYDKYLGGVLPFDLKIKDDNTQLVFNDTKDAFKKQEAYKDGVKIDVDKGYLVTAMNSGIIVYIGEKEGYSKVIIVQQVDGIDLWYGNVTNTNHKLYDYVEKGDVLGEVVDDKLYLVYQSKGEFLDYKEYLK